jgi:hypothetical protein
MAREKAEQGASRGAIDDDADVPAVLGRYGKEDGGTVIGVDEARSRDQRHGSGRIAPLGLRLRPKARRPENEECSDATSHFPSLHFGRV